MGLVPLQEVLDAAKKGGYAVGAFNASNMEIVQAIAESAEKETSPVIVQVSQGAVRYAGLDYLAALVKTAAEKTEVPLVLHLDHGSEHELLRECIRSGFTSVMFDGSHLPLEKNITLTRQVVAMAAGARVGVEAELGRIGGTEDEIDVESREALMTDPEEAGYFVSATGVDALAVAVGTQHGPYSGIPELDFERLERIRDKVSVPLVLHGASGVPDEAVLRAIRLGVRKINIDTEIRQAFLKGVSKFWENRGGSIDPRKMLAPAKEEAKKVIGAKMKLFGSSGRAL